MIVTIDKLDSDAVGVAHNKDRVVLVPKTIVGEKIEITEVEKKSKFDIAKNYRCVQCSADRIEACCEYYKICGGCALQHVSAEFEKGFKIKKVKNSLKHIANIELDNIDFVDSEKRFGYRNKIVFAVNDKYELGMYEQNGRNFVKIDKCLLVSETVNDIIAILSSWLKSEKIVINHIAIREVESRYSIVLIGESKPQIDKLIILLDKELKNKYQIYFNKNSAFKDLITPDLSKLYGIDIYNAIYNIKYPISPNSFMQVNNDISCKLYEEVVEEINDEYVINAYSGSGLLSAILATKSNKVYGVEIVKNAHLNAEDLKKKNNISNMVNICGKAENEILKLLAKNPQYSVVLDPPRKGVNNKLLTLLNESKKINKIIYISCSPNSLAKDLRLLANFKISKIKLFNMFPNTSHVETFVVLKRK